MKNPGCGEPLSHPVLQELPGHPAPLTATSNYMQPAFAYLETKTPEAGEISGYSVIVEVALDHAPYDAAQLTRFPSFASGTRPAAPCSPWLVVFPPYPRR